MIDDVWLVGDLFEVDALRQRGLDLLHRGFDILAELDDVGALGHHDADAERRLAALMHKKARRVLEASRYRRDVAEAEARAAELDGRVGHGLGAVDGAGDAQRHALRACLDGACRDHGILLCQRIEDGLRRNSKGGELGVAEFDEDPLVLHTVEIDLGHVLHLEQLLAHGLGHALELRKVGAVGGQRVEDGVDIAVFVIDVGADHLRGQVGADIAQLLAQLVEELRHFARRRVVLELDLHRREGWLGVGRDFVEIGQLLQLLLDRVRNLILHFLRRGAGPDRGDDSDLDGEVRILGAPELEVGEGACRRQHQDHE